jgi:hypothetical protein
MTYLEAVNAVLLRLRQSQVSTWESSDYSRLIGQFVNEAKREVEDAHEWHALRETISASIVVDDTTVTFSGTSERTRIIQVFNDTDDCPMYQKPRDRIIYHRNVGSTTSATPNFYGLSGYDASGNIKLELWPTSNGSYDLLLDCINPQSDLASNNTRISVAPEPVKLRALALALSERGDDGGQPFQQVMQEYSIALTDAVNRDKDNGPYHEAWVVP